MNSGIGSKALRYGSLSWSLGERYMLTVREAEEYFGIGELKFRDFLDRNPDKTYPYGMGNCQLIRRERFEEYLDECESI